MQFFKNTLNEPAPVAVANERRREQRYAINPAFPLKAVLSFVSRDDTGSPMSDSRHNWYWKGTLVNFSSDGARMRMGPGLRAEVGDTCDLLISIGELELRVPSDIANIQKEDDATVFGLHHSIADEETRSTYRRLVEAVAIGSTLVEQIKQTRPDESGYIVEQYVSEVGARLTIWRHPVGSVPAAFEFVLPEGVVRGASGMLADYLAINAGSVLTVAPLPLANAIHQTFQWATPNIAATVPGDVRELLQQFSG